MQQADILKAIQNSDVDFFTRNSIDWSEKPNHAQLALYQAVRNNQLLIVETLLNQGVNPNKQTHEGDTPLNCAAKNDYIDIIDVLLQHRADVNVPDSTGVTPLMIAANQGNVVMTKQFLAKKAFMSKVSDAGKTALALAIIGGHMNVVELLLSYRKNLLTEEVTIEHRQHYVFALAVIFGHLDLTKKLLDHKYIRLHQQDRNGSTLLHLAVEYNHVNLVELLLDEYKANIEVRDWESSTPLFQANSAEMVSVLLKHGANIHSTDCDDNTPAIIQLLHLSKDGEFTEEEIKKLPVLLELLRWGPDIQDIDFDDDSSNFVDFDSYSDDYDLDEAMYYNNNNNIVTRFFENLSQECTPLVELQLYKTCIRCLMVGSIIGSDNTTTLRQIIYRRNNALQGSHPVLMAWENIKKAIVTILETKNISCEDTEIPDILHFIFSVYPRFAQESREAKYGSQCMILPKRLQHLSPEQTTKALVVLNPLWRLGIGLTLPPEVIALIAEHVLNEALQKHQEHSKLPINKLRKLYIELRDLTSPLAIFAREAMDYPFEKQAWSCHQMTHLTTHISQP